MVRILRYTYLPYLGRYLVLRNEGVKRAPAAYVGGFGGGGQYVMTRVYIFNVEICCIVMDDLPADCTTWTYCAVRICAIRELFMETL